MWTSGSPGQAPVELPQYTVTIDAATGSTLVVAIGSAAHRADG